MSDSERLKRRIVAGVRAIPSPTRAVTRRREALVLGGAVAAMVIVFLFGPPCFFGQRGGVRVGPRPGALVAATTLGSAGIALAIVWLAIGRGRSMLGRSRALLVAAIGAGPLLLLGWKLGCSGRYAHMMDVDPARPGLRCLVLSLSTAVAPLVAFAFTRRAGGALQPVATGAAMGVTAGACAWIFTDLWCPLAAVPHLLLGHLLPVALMALAGVTLGRMLAIRWRATAQLSA